MAKPNDTSFSISIHALREEGDGPAGGTAYHHRISIHALREEGDVAQGLFLVGGYQFLSTPSARRATQGWHHDHHGQQISIHALREEGDIERICVHSSESDFYPRPPRGGRPSASGDIGCRLQISIHALREEGDRCFFVFAQSFIISIHALREEGDTAMSIPPYCGPISIHALREEGDDPGYHGPDIFKPFLSTPSARRATSGPTGQTAAAYAISIHALREEGDLRHQRPCILLQQISIHALREEGDAVTNVNRTHVKDFYPRPPRGGRRLWHSGTKAGRDFYPRPPRGGRLSVLYRPSGRWRISIHALREEGDATFAAAVQDLEKFLSTPSARRATGGPQRPRGNSRISIHALREEGDFAMLGHME